MAPERARLVYLNIFATPEAGAKGTAAYLLQFSNYGAMRLNAPASNVLQGTSYTGEAGFAPAANPTQAQVTSLATRLGSASIPVVARRSRQRDAHRDAGEERSTVVPAACPRVQGGDRQDARDSLTHDPRRSDDGPGGG